MCQVNLQNGLWCIRQTQTLCSPSVKTSGPLTADLYPLSHALDTAIFSCWSTFHSILPSRKISQIHKPISVTSCLLKEPLLPPFWEEVFTSHLWLTAGLQGKYVRTLTSSCVHSQEALGWAGSLSSSMPGSLSWHTLASHLCHSEAEPPENMTDRLLSQLAALCPSVDIKFITKYTTLSCEPTMNSSQRPCLLPSSCLPMAISSQKHLRSNHEIRSAHEVRTRQSQVLNLLGKVVYLKRNDCQFPCLCGNRLGGKTL